jgi:hypothetical protein
MARLKASMHAAVCTVMSMGMGAAACHASESMPGKELEGVGGDSGALGVPRELDHSLTCTLKHHQADVVTYRES